MWYANAIYMNQIARQRCTQDTADTTNIPTSPLPPKTMLRVMQRSPAGLAVVGEERLSKTTLGARIIFAIKLKASNPAKQEQAKWKLTATWYVRFDVSQ
jgi:hypothetical protein